MINARSLSFRLIGWYALILLLLAVIFGTASFSLIREYLLRSLRDRQVMRARFICDSIPRWVREPQPFNWEERIESAFAPKANNRLVLIKRDQTVLYNSVPYLSRLSSGNSDKTWDLSLAGTKVVSFTSNIKLDGHLYTIECAAPTESVEDVLQDLLVFVAIITPFLVAIATLGGYLLIKKALLPVVTIADKAQRISVENLNDRLPVPRTGDELERLSHALNDLLSRLDESVQHTRRFLADASHELRTPLTVLRGGIESLINHNVPPRDVERILAALLEETERLTKIVEALLALSRLDAGEAQQESVPVDLGKLVEVTTEQMSLLAEDKHISAQCIKHDGVTVLGDPFKLKQVIVNLLDNAIRYTPENGSIVLRVVAEMEQAILEVQDNGIGIPPEAIPHLFDRFFRLDNARSRNLGGAGLGLAIVKSICSAHRGRIEVNSTLGKGSSFRVVFPLHAFTPLLPHPVAHPSNPLHTFRFKLC